MAHSLLGHKLHNNSLCGGFHFILILHDETAGSAERYEHALCFVLPVILNRPSLAVRIDECRKYEKKIE
jgi:hypothetical protein